VHRIHRAALVAAGLFLITALGPLARPAQAAPVPPSSDVQVAQQWVAGWIGRQVQADQAKITNSQTGEIDYSHIAGAVWALASTGLARNEIEAAAQVLLNSGPTFIGPAAEASTQWGHVATVALALQVAGHDPTAYPAGDGTTRDLIAELRSVIAADGSPGASATGYSGALLVLALARSPEGVPANLVTWLKAQPCADPGSPNFGAFGFTGPGSCDSGDTDSTALAIQGLLAAGVPTTDPAITGAQTYLEINQEVGGGWGTPGFTPANAMSTGLVVQALRPLGSPAVAKGEQYLLTLIVGCNPNGPSPAFGAMAYDAGYSPLTAYTIDANKPTSPLPKAWSIPSPFDRPIQSTFATGGVMYLLYDLREDGLQIVPLLS